MEASLESANKYIEAKCQPKDVAIEEFILNICQKKVKTANEELLMNKERIHKSWIISYESYDS